MKSKLLNIFIILCVSTVALLFAHGNMSKSTIGFLEVTRTVSLVGTLTTDVTNTTSKTNWYFKSTTTATSGTERAIRVRVEANAASAATGETQAGYFQAVTTASGDGGTLTGVFANFIAKNASTTVNGRAIFAEAESEATATAITDLIGIHVRTKVHLDPSDEYYGVLVENEKMATGFTADAYLGMKSTTWGATGESATYGIDMNGITDLATADWRMINGETIGNLADGLIDFGGELKSVLTYSKDVGATTRDLLVDNTGLIGYQASSKKYKKNIENLNADFVNKVYNLRPVSFDWKGSGVRGYGMIAEETAQVLPEVVSMDKDGFPETVNYHQMVPFLLKALQDQQARILELEKNL